MTKSIHWAVTTMVGMAMASAFSTATASESQPVVVELFTSQSCYSCPPAEAYLGELAKDPNILALEWHVDYWDTLVYGSAGRWKDPFSSPSYTERQAEYNFAISGSSRIYTPQMIIDGAAEAVGSRRAEVARVIASASEQAKPVHMAIRPSDGSSLQIDIDGTIDTPATVWLVQFIPAHTTDVLRGENHGKTLTNHNIVTGVDRLAEWKGGPLTLTVDRPDGDLGCAVLVQRGASSPIYAAQNCNGAKTS